MTVEGTWNTIAKTPLGHMKGKLVLRVEGNALSGTCTSQFGSDDFSGGKVEGENFEFLVSNKTPMGPMKVEYKGTVEGDKITGMTTTKPLGLKTRFEATRV